MKTYKDTHSQISIDGDDVYLRALRAANPAIINALEHEIKRIEEEAQKHWPVRQKRYGKSQNSKDQFETSIKIIPPNKVRAAVENKAPYAWAIVAGPDTTGGVKEKRRVANELMWKPAKKGIRKVLEDIAKNTVKKV